MRKRLNKLKPTASQTATAMALSFGAVMTVGQVAAQADNLCKTNLVQNLINPLLEAAFQIGPVLGMFSAVVSLVMMSQVTSKDKKKKWKERRNDAFLYGVIGVLASGYIVQFVATAVLGLSTNCLGNTSVLSTLTAHVADLAVLLF